MLYDYECKKCLYTEEVKQSMSDKPLTVCPSCKKKSFRRVINSIPYVSVKNYNTIGSLADKNWKNMGHYEKETRMEEDGVNKKIEKKEQQEHLTKLANLNSKQKTKYIETGEL